MTAGFINIVAVGAISSLVASMLAVFVGRRWFGFALFSTFSEFGFAVLAAFIFSITAPMLLTVFGGGGLLCFGQFPIWAVFSLAHRDRWDAFDGLKFVGLQALMILLMFVFLCLLTAPVVN